MPNITDIFRAACAAVGVEDKSVPADGEWHSANLIDDPRGRGDGRIKLFSDGQGGIVWNHKSGEREVFFYNRRHSQSLTPEEKQKQEKAKQRQALARKTRQNQAACKATALWQTAKPAGRHPYLTKKHIQPHGARIANWKRRYQDNRGNWRQITIADALLIPMFNPSGQLCNLQAIFPDESPELGRGKDFLAGGQLTGVFWWLGKKSTDTVCIAEGFATAATITEQTGHRVYIAFTAGNLLAVGRVIRERLPDARLIFCADNDEKTQGNPGLTKANEAALAVDGLVAVPPVAGDFNDYVNALQGASHGQ